MAWSLAQKERRPFKYFQERMKKENLARRTAERAHIEAGLICVLSGLLETSRSSSNCGASNWTSFASDRFIQIGDRDHMQADKRFKGGRPVCRRPILSQYGSYVNLRAATRAETGKTCRLAASALSSHSPNAIPKSTLPFRLSIDASNRLRSERKKFR